MKNTAVAFLVVSAALAGCMTTNTNQLGTPDNERAAEINLQLGTDYLRKNNLAQAKEKIDKAVEQNPSNADAQITAGSLAGLHGDRLREVATQLLCHDLAHIIASDAHTPTGSRAPA